MARCPTRSSADISEVSGTWVLRLAEGLAASQEKYPLVIDSIVHIIPVIIEIHLDGTGCWG